MSTIHKFDSEFNNIYLYFYPSIYIYIYLSLDLSGHLSICVYICSPLNSSATVEYRFYSCLNYGCVLSLHFSLTACMFVHLRAQMFLIVNQCDSFWLFATSHRMHSVLLLCNWCSSWRKESAFSVLTSCPDPKTPTSETQERNVRWQKRTWKVIWRDLK